MYGLKRGNVALSVHTLLASRNWRHDDYTENVCELLASCLQVAHDGHLSFFSQMELMCSKSPKFGTDSNDEMTPSRNSDFCYPLVADATTSRPKTIASC